RITPVGGPGSTESAACRSSESTVAVTRAGPAWLPRVTSTRAIPAESVATLSVSTSALTARNTTTFPTKGLPRLERSEEHTSELQSRSDLVCRLLLEKKKKRTRIE